MNRPTGKINIELRKHGKAFEKRLREGLVSGLSDDLSRIDAFAENAIHDIYEPLFKGILEAQWIDGPPKDTSKGEYVLVTSFPTGADDEYKMVVDLKNINWDRLIKGFGPIIKHMELPSYE